MACNGATHPQTRRTQRLQKARCAKPSDRIYHRLTFENPAGHRKSQRRIANMHKPHSPTPEQHKMLGRTLGEEPLTETNLAPVTRKCNAPKVLCANTEVIDGHRWGWGYFGVWGGRGRLPDSRRYGKLVVSLQLSVFRKNRFSVFGFRFSVFGLRSSETQPSVVSHGWWQIQPVVSQIGRRSWIATRF